MRPSHRCRGRRSIVAPSLPESPTADRSQRPVVGTAGCPSPQTPHESRVHREPLDSADRARANGWCPRFARVPRPEGPKTTRPRHVAVRCPTVEHRPHSGSRGDRVPASVPAEPVRESGSSSSSSSRRKQSSVGCHEYGVDALECYPDTFRGTMACGQLATDAGSLGRALGVGAFVAQGQGDRGSAVPPGVTMRDRRRPSRNWAPSPPLENGAMSSAFLRKRTFGKPSLWNGPNADPASAIFSFTYSLR